MIQNEKQYKVTRKQLNHLEQALEASRVNTSELPPAIHKAMLQGITSKIDELKQELEAFNSLRDQKEIVIEGLEELPVALIKARIAKGLSQAELAGLVKMQAQQIQRYEANIYKGIGFDKIITICKALNVHFADKVKLLL